MRNDSEKHPHTPILDLETPLPPCPPQTRPRIPGFGFTLVPLLITNLILFDVIALGTLFLYAAIFSAILVHEMGHVLAGWIVGFQFKSIQVAWFSVSRENGKLAFMLAPKCITWALRVLGSLEFTVCRGGRCSLLQVVPPPNLSVVVTV